MVFVIRNNRMRMRIDRKDFIEGKYDLVNKWSSCARWGNDFDWLYIVESENWFDFWNLWFNFSDCVRTSWLNVDVSNNEELITFSFANGMFSHIVSVFDEKSSIASVPNVVQLWRLSGVVDGNI